MSGPRPRRALAAATVLACSGGLVAGAVVPASAACAQQPDIRAAAKAADVVFSATVDSGRQVGRAGERLRELSVEVDRVYQGTVGRDTATVTVPLDDRPRAGEEWFFFAGGEESRFTLEECSGSRVASARTTREVEDELGAGEVYVEPAPPREPLTYERQDVTVLPSLSRMLAPGASLTLFALLGLVLTRRRRR